MKKQKTNSNSSSISGMVANLKIKAVDGKFLRDIDEEQGRGKMDPFIVLSLGDQKFTTKVATNQGKTPKWNETFSFYLDRNKLNELFVEAWDKDSDGNDILGSTILNLLEIEASDEWEMNIPLQLKKKDVGTVKLIFEFLDKKTAEIVPLTKPMTMPVIEFQSCDYAQQMKDINDRKSKLLQDLQISQKFKIFKFLSENVQQAILKGFDHLRDTNSQNQVKDLGLFLKQYEK